MSDLLQLTETASYLFNRKPIIDEARRPLRKRSPPGVVFGEEISPRTIALRRQYEALLAYIGSPNL